MRIWYIDWLMIICSTVFCSLNAVTSSFCFYQANPIQILHLMQLPLFCLFLLPIPSWPLLPHCRLVLPLSCFLQNLWGFTASEISLVEASASIFKINSVLVMLSRRFSFFNPFSILYSLLVLSAQALVIISVRVAN